MRTASEPMLNVPNVVAAIIAALALVHGVREWVLSPAADQLVLQLFAFVPARYEPSPLGMAVLPGGLGAEMWTFVTYAFIHGDMTHLGLNAVWLLAFGSAIARRFGTVRFLAFFAVTAAAGAAAHLATHPGQFVPVVGASAAISGCMAAAMRFVFQAGGPLGLFSARDDAAYLVPAPPLSAVLRDPRVLAFLGVWFGLNLVFGAGSLSIDGSDQPIAWEAHVGGFVAGLLMFALFDPIRRLRGADKGRSDAEVRRP